MRRIKTLVLSWSCILVLAAPDIIASQRRTDAEAGSATPQLYSAALECPQESVAVSLLQVSADRAGLIGRAAHSTLAKEFVETLPAFKPANQAGNVQQTRISETPLAASFFHVAQARLPPLESLDSGSSMAQESDTSLAGLPSIAPSFQDNYLLRNTVLGFPRSSPQLSLDKATAQLAAETWSAQTRVIEEPEQQQRSIFTQGLSAQSPIDGIGGKYASIGVQALQETTQEREARDAQALQESAWTLADDEAERSPDSPQVQQLLQEDASLRSQNSELRRGIDRVRSRMEPSIHLSSRSWIILVLLVCGLMCAALLIVNFRLQELSGELQEQKNRRLLFEEKNGNAKVIANTVTTKPTVGVLPYNRIQFSAPLLSAGSCGLDKRSNTRPAEQPIAFEADTMPAMH